MTMQNFVQLLFTIDRQDISKLKTIKVERPKRKILQKAAGNLSTCAVVVF